MEEIMRRKLEEYQKRLTEERGRAEEVTEELKRREIMRKILTPEARARLNNLRMVKPDLVNQLEVQLIQLAHTGRMPTPITDEVLKEILCQLVERRGNIKIKYMRRG